MPEHPSIGIHAGPLFGALGILAGIIQARRDGRGLPDRDRAVRRRRVHGLVPHRDVEGLRAARVRGDGQHEPTTTSAARPAPPGMREGVRYQMYEAADGHVLFMASRAGVLEELLRRRRAHGPVRAVARQASTPTTPAATASCSASCARSSRRRRRRVDRVRRRDEHADRAREHAEDHRRRPAVPGPASVDPGGRARRRRAALPDQDPRRGAAGARRGRPRSASTPTRCCATCSATTRTEVAALRDSGALG